MKIGDKVRTRISTGKCEDWMEPQTGTVTWIHPKGRFCLVEFNCGGNILRETFRCSELQ